MSKGIPRAIKCPKCKRGTYGRREREKGIVIDESTAKELARGRYMRWVCLATCRDCDHKWWTTLRHDVLSDRAARARKDIIILGDDA